MSVLNGNTLAQNTQKPHNSAVRRQMSDPAVLTRLAQYAETAQFQYLGHYCLLHAQGSCSQKSQNLATSPVGPDPDASHFTAEYAEIAEYRCWLRTDLVVSLMPNTTVHPIAARMEPGEITTDGCCVSSYRDESGRADVAIHPPPSHFEYPRIPQRG